MFATPVKKCQSEVFEEMKVLTSTAPGLVVIATEPHVVHVNVSSVREPACHGVRYIFGSSDSTSEAPLIEPTFVFGPNRRRVCLA